MTNHPNARRAAIEAASALRNIRRREAITPATPRPLPVAPHTDETPAVELTTLAETIAEPSAEPTHHRPHRKPPQGHAKHADD